MTLKMTRLEKSPAEVSTNPGDCQVPSPPPLCQPVLLTQPSTGPVLTVPHAEP